MTARKPGKRTRERVKTDDSLRAERKNTDAVLKGGRVTTEGNADDVVDKARDVADAVLSAARLKEDRKSGPAGKAAVVGARAKADRDVRATRAVADVALDSDRKEQADVLNALLVHERAATDAYLLTERARSDEVVAHRDDFLAMVAHDVRNLLNGVVLSLELLRPDEAEPAAHVSAAASRIRRYVARMNRLIGDLVDVTSIDAGKLSITPVRADARDLVAEATDVFQPAAREKGLSLSAEVPARPLLAAFDHDRMLQVFANLVSNSIKFTPQGGKVAVRVGRSRGALRFSVKDTGVGIPAPMLEAVFERFWQVGKNDRRGQGLGLYISKSIVQAHGGRIWAESAPGRGSQFYFTLPLSVAPPDGERTSRTRNKARPQRRVKTRADRRRPRKRPRV